MPIAPTISSIINHEYSDATSTVPHQNDEDDFMSAPYIRPTASGPVFHFLMRLPPELQLHIFTLLLDSLIGKTRGLTRYPIDDYTQIRQLMDRSDLKVTLRINKHIRNLVLTAWKTSLSTNRHSNNARQERRVEKALMLIGLLEDKEAHVDSIRLLLTSNASWEKVKRRARQLSAFCNVPLVLEAKNLGSLFHRLAVTSVTLQLHVLTYSNSYWNPTPGMLHHCPDLCQSNYMHGARPWARNYVYAFSACPTLEAFEDIWKDKCEQSRQAADARGDEVPVAALSKKILMVRLPWMKGTIRYDAVREEMYKAMVAYMEDVKTKMKAEADIASRKRVKEIEDSAWAHYW